MLIKMLKDEYWYGGCVSEGTKQPIGEKDTLCLDMTLNPSPNQAMPLFLSTSGRYIWRDTGFMISFENGYIKLPDDVVLVNSCNNLRGAYLEAMKMHFPFHKIKLDNLLFTAPQYNSWIELTFFQNEKDILEYANGIYKNGLPSGVLMIDDGWSDFYGKWVFSAQKFPSPNEMLQKLKKMGFEVMLWVCPFVTPDTLAFREASNLGLLICNENGKPYICEWWNGYSAVLDFSNPQAVEWFDNQLQALVKMGVAGFKFDAGDSIYYPTNMKTFKETTPNEQSRLWAEFGERYSFNEYRAAFNAGGMSLMQRLCDKAHTWDESGIASLLPNSLLQGLTGHPFSCPDMIGGGEYMNFRKATEIGIDQELFCRHSEAACLLPAMQFSAAPWRVLTKENFDKIKQSIAVRERYIDVIMAAIEHAKDTGEPVVRYMEYQFPNMGMAKITDQFMLGSSLLVAPILEKGEKSRIVIVPQGDWDFNGTLLHGNNKGIKLTPPEGEPIVLCMI